MIFFDYIWNRIEYSEQKRLPAPSGADYGPCQSGHRFSNPLARPDNRREEASCPFQPAPKPLRLFGASNPAIALGPATGYRHYTTGALADVGANGHWWSSSSYASGNLHAGSFFCDASRMNPLNNDNRANGFPVRCVQHLPELLISFPIPHLRLAGHAGSMPDPDKKQYLRPGMAGAKASVSAVG